jgi:hypothetical protein
MRNGPFNQSRQPTPGLLLSVLPIPSARRGVGYTALESARVDVPAFSQAIEMKSP